MAPIYANTTHNRGIFEFVNRQSEYSTLTGTIRTTTNDFSLAMAYNSDQNSILPNLKWTQDIVYVLISVNAS